MKTKTIKDFKPGDLLVLTSRTNRGEERRAAQVSAVNYNGNGLVTFTPPDVSRDHYAKIFGADVTLDSGSGAFDPSKLGADGRRLPGTPYYGFYVVVEKVGYRAPWKPSAASLYGNPGYDLLHDAPRRSGS